MDVHGVGPSPCEFMVVGEGPGWEEDREGEPFVGKTGNECRRFMDGVNLPDFDEVFRTNLYRRYQGKDYKWTQEDYERDSPFLITELQEVLPKIIISLGRPATRCFLGDVDIDAVQGLPWFLPETCEIYPCPPDPVIVFPITHPASGFHNPEMSPYVVDGFNQLAEFLNGNLEPRRLYDDRIKNPTYIEITSEQQLRAVLASVTGRTQLHIDTEGWPGNPWSLQFSFEPGYAYLIRQVRRELLQLFTGYLHRVRPRLTFHSALHDLGMGRALGTDFEGLEFDDTMVMAYLLQLVPQGLKPSSLRFCNMKMMEYSDVVGDSANELARSYLTWLWDSEQADYEEKCQAELLRLQTTPYTDARGKVHPGRKVRKPPQLPKSSLHKAVSRIMQSKRPKELWDDQVEDIRVAGYYRLGPMPEATLDLVEPEISIPYGCRDADATGRLLPEYSRRIDQMGLRGVYDLELSTYPLLDRMQRIGIKPDLEHFAGLSKLLDYEIAELASGLHRATGIETFNANSGDQVADYLFGTLGIEEVKMTKSGRGSTNDKILEALEHEHPEFPVISDIRTYREFYKLKNTFVDRLPDFVNRWPFDGRVHTTLRTTRVVTGRLAASDPNLLAQPEHGIWAEEFKRGWVADAGHVLGAWDESQIELRGLAHLSQDPVMLAVFRGEVRNPDGSLIDLHAALAERIFGVKPKDQSKHKHRLPAKAINFGIPMGLTCKGLSVELRKNGVDADEDTAQRWLDETLGLYKGVKTYMESRIAEARRNGYIRCLSGRIRYIGGIRSRDDRVREEAERFAFSTPIQESATYVMKIAEKAVWEDVLPYFWKQGVWCEPLIQIHDCLKLEIEEGYQNELDVLMREAMVVTPSNLFSVPLAVEGEYGRTMADVVSF